MSSDLPSSPTPRGARTVARILDAAAKTFGRDGFQGASMTAVAKAARVSKGLLHYHFQSKEHLLLEAQRSTFRHLHARFRDRFQRGDRGVPTALDALDALWASLRDMQVWAPFMVETLAMAAQGSPLRDDVDHLISESMGLLHDGIDGVFGADVSRLPVPPDRLAGLVRVALYGLVVELALAKTDADRAAVDLAYRDLRDLFARLAQAGPAD